MKRFDWTILFRSPYKVFVHITFWIMVSFAVIFFKEYPDRMTGVTMVCLVLQVTLELLIPCYTQNLLVVPVFKKYGWLWGTAAYTLQILLLVILLPHILNTAGILFPITDRVDWNNEHITFSVITFTVIASIYKIALDGLIADKQQKENELRHLKAQLNPHFLFNTLNNLYGLSVAESKKLPDLMLRLSELLRYSLYDTNQRYVPLQKELTYISNYVELEKIRLSDKVSIRLEISGNDQQQHIAPLLLLIFIENGFKHFSAAEGTQAFVHITFSLADNQLCMQVKNSIDPGHSLAAGKVGGGLGLYNVKQRLDLIYPGKYTLNTVSQNAFFEIILKIDLN